MQTTSRQLIRTTGALAAAGAALLSPRLTAAAESDAFPDFENYITVGGQAASIDGNRAAFQTRTGQSEDGGVGIEDARYSREVAKDTTLTMDGHAMTGTEDYRLAFKLEKIDLGSVSVGYKTFRTFYDGVGGFFPQNSAWQTITDSYPGVPESLHVDRGQFWAEARFARENRPELTVRYVNETRDGRKDSTIWGDTDNTGQNYGTLNGGLTTGSGITATGVNGNASVRKNIPSYLQLDERHQSLEGTVKHQIGNTQAQVTVLGDWTSVDNGRFVTRFPGEARAPSSGGTGSAPAVGATDWTKFNNEIVQSNYDVQDTATFGVNGTTITELNDKLTLRTGAAFQDVSSTFGGDRILVTAQPITVVPNGATRTIQTYNVKDLDGDGSVHAYTGLVGFDYRPIDTFAASLALRGEDRAADSEGGYDVVTSTTGATPVASTTHRFEASSSDEQSLTPVLDLRYTGVRDLTLFSSASRKYGSGTEIITPAYNDATTVTPRIYYNTVSEDNGDYSIGASWRVSPALTLRGEPFYKDHVYHAKGYNTNSSTTATPAASTFDNNYQLDSRFWGVKLTAAVRPLGALTFTTRYVWQRGERQVTGFLPLYPEYDSMSSTTHNIGETIDWNPTKQFYMQVSANLVLNTMSTAYRHVYDTTTLVPNATPSPSTGASTIQIPANRFIQAADSDYVTFSALAGFVVTARDDVQVQFTAYKADNYDADLALYTQPYGASATETTVTVGLKHKFTKHVIGNAKVGYCDSQSDTTGGYTDFRGPLGYLSLTCEL